MLMSLFYNVVNVHALQLIIAETCINDVHAPKHDLSNLSHHIRSNVKTKIQLENDIILIIAKIL